MSNIDNRNLLLQDTIDLIGMLNNNLDRHCALGHEIIVKVSHRDNRSARSYIRPLIEIDVIDQFYNQV